MEPEHAHDDNDLYIFIETKVGRLVTAVYMLTTFISDAEPLKWKLRQRGIDLLAAATNLSDTSGLYRSEKLKVSRSHMKEIVSLLDVGYLSEYITEMNYSILRKEYLEAIAMISERKEVRESMSNVVLSKGFFQRKLAGPKKDYKNVIVGSGGSVIDKKVERIESIAQEYDKPLRAAEKPIAQRDARVSQSPVASAGEHQETAPMTPSANRPSVPSLTHEQPSSKQRTLSSSRPRVPKRTGEKKNKRRNQIIDTLKDNSGITIKDIADNVTGCSEKTIQRELVELVSEGVVKRDGERRWSRYSLVRI